MSVFGRKIVKVRPCFQRLSVGRALVQVDGLQTVVSPGMEDDESFVLFSDLFLFSDPKTRFSGFV